LFRALGILSVVAGLILCLSLSRAARAGERRPSEEEMRAAVDKLKKLLAETPPSKYETLEARVMEVGEKAGLLGDAGTLAGLESAGGKLGGLHGKLGKFCLCFTTAAILKKQFVDRKPAGWDALKAVSLWSTGKIAGGPVAAAVGLMQYGAERAAEGLYASVDAKWYRAYSEYNLRKGPPSGCFAAFAGKSDRAAIEKALAGRLDGFWNDEAYFEQRGWSVVEVKYVREGTSVREAYRRRFLAQYVIPALVEMAESAAIKAEVALVLERKWAEQESHLDTVRVEIPRIIDVGSGMRTGEVAAKLLHRGKQLGRVQADKDSGAVFKFKADEIRDAQGKLAPSLDLELEAAGKARLNGNARLQLRLGDMSLKTGNSAAGRHLTYVHEEPVEVRLAYPVTVSVSGKLPRFTSRIRISSIPLLGRYADPNNSRSVLSSRGKGGVFQFAAVPSGRCTVEIDGRAAGGFSVLGPVSRQCKAPGKLDGSKPVQLPAKPDFRAEFEAVKKELPGLSDPDRPLATTRARIGKAIAALAGKAQAWSREAYATDRHISARHSWLKNAKISAARRKAANAKLKRAETQLAALKRQFHAELERIKREDAQLRKAIDRRNSASADDLKRTHSAASGKLFEAISGLRNAMRRAEKAAAQVVEENVRDTIGRMTPAEAERKLKEIEKLNADATAASGKLAAALSAVDRARNKQLAALEKWNATRVLTGSPRRHDIGRVRLIARLKLECADLQAFAPRRRSAAAMAEVRSRLARRKAGDAEVAKLLKETLDLARKLPNSGAYEVQRAVVYWEKQFAGLVGKPETQRVTELRYLAGEIGKVLDKHKSVLGDLRRGGKRSATDFSRLAEKLARLRRLLAEARAFAQENRRRMLAEVVSRDRRARLLRDGPGGRAGRLESEVATALANPDAYFKPAEQATAGIEKLLREAAAHAPAHMGKALEKLSTAWTEIDKLPAPMAPGIRYKIHALARRLCAKGALEAYARKSNRPLLVFDAAKSPFAHAMVPLTSSGHTSHKGLTAHLVGVPKGCRPTLELWTATDIRRIPPAPGGKYRIGVTTGDREVCIVILTGLKDVVPICGEYLGQLLVF